MRLAGRLGAGRTRPVAGWAGDAPAGLMMGPRRSLSWWRVIGSVMAVIPSVSVRCGGAAVCCRRVTGPLGRGARGSRFGARLRLFRLHRPPGSLAGYLGPARELYPGEEDAGLGRVAARVSLSHDGALRRPGGARWWPAG